MANVTAKDKVSVPKSEYLRLRKLERRFADFLTYVEHLIDIRDAREETRKKKIVSQEKLFRRLGL